MVWGQGHAAPHPSLSGPWMGRGAMGPRCWSFPRLCAGGFPDGREEVGSVATEHAGPVARGGDGLQPKIWLQI